MSIKKAIKSIISIILSVHMVISVTPSVSAAQHNEYIDPADVWMTVNNRTNELDMNATVTYETQYCPVCDKETACMTYRVPEYTKSGETALNRNVRYSDGTCVDGTSKGNLDSGIPGQDAYYTGYHWTKSVCQSCGTINAIDGPGAYDFNRNVYCLNPCDYNFFLDFDNTTYEPYDEDYHTVTLKAGKYCQFCKGTKERGTNKKEAHDFTEVVDAQLGNNRFCIHQHCDDCGYETSEYVTAKSVITSYYGEVDGDAHTLTVSDLSDRGVKTSIRYGKTAEKCNLTSAPNFTEAGYNTVYYEITYMYDGESMTENGVSYVWLLDEPEISVTIIMPETRNETHEHDFRYIETVPPTCNTLGYERWQCKDCGALEKKNYVQMTGHDYETVTIKDATCKENGLILNLCKNCGDFNTVTTTTGAHKYNVKTINPTCQMVGYTEHKCELCGDTYLTDIQPIVSHAFESIVKEPTCTDKGYTTSTCSMCGLTNVTDYTEPLGHDYDEGKTVTNSTCEGEGVIEYTCSRCGDKMIKSTSANGHKPGAPANCTEPQICEDCGTILQLPKGHTYESRVIAPTCTEMGYTVYKCKDCGDEYTGDYTDKAEHKYTKTVTEPTCTEHGFSTYVCSECGASYISDFVKQLGHTPSEWIIDTPATIENSGEKHIECTTCGEKLQNVEIPKLADIDRTDEDGNAEVGRFSVLLTGKDGVPVFNGEVIIDANDNISIKLPNGRLLDIADPTTVTVFFAETQQPAENINISIEDANGNHATGTTNENGQAVFPGDSTNTGENNGTIGTEGEEETNTYVVTVTDKDNTVIPGCTIKVDENNNIIVTLPEGIIPSNEQPIIIIVKDQNGTPQQEVEITVVGDNDYSATGKTDSDGKTTVPETNLGYTDENGKVTVDGYTVTVENKDGPIENAYVERDEKGKISVKLPDGKTLKTSNQTTVTVLDKDGKTVKGVSVTVTDNKNGKATKSTDSKGKITVPVKSSGGSSSSSSGRSSGGGVSLATVKTNTTAEEHKAYIYGYEDGTFRPEKDMTRAEAAAIFARLISEKKGETISGSSKFSDVKAKDWFSKDVAYLEKYNIIKGYEDKTFRPEKAVTRAEFVTMAVRYYGLFNEVKKTGQTVKYTDLNSSYWAYDDIAYAKNIGWLNGYADGTFKGDNNITRAEVVTVVNRATGRKADESYINKNLSVLNKFTDLKNNAHWAYYDIEEAANTHKATKAGEAETWTK
ncbi:MAG: S-layer homology domain-containing protein [Clostridia bacterium]|nr:S-layer homology domain-containing protein [Clostridia bacterium]